LQQILGAANLAFRLRTSSTLTQGSRSFIPEPNTRELFRRVPARSADRGSICLTNDVVSVPVSNDIDIGKSPKTATAPYQVYFGRKFGGRARDFIIDTAEPDLYPIELRNVDWHCPFDAGPRPMVDVISYNDNWQQRPGRCEQPVLYQIGTPWRIDFRLMSVNQDTPCHSSTTGYLQQTIRSNQNNASYSGFVAGQFQGA